MKYILPILLTITLLIIWACNEETAKPRAEWGYDYFPLEIGMVWNYEMDSITFRPQVGGVLHDSVHLLVRETLVDTLRDLENKLWYRGERYDRYSDSLPWRFRQTFLLYRDRRKAIRREDNLEFVKMTFPVEQYKNWDGHVAFDENKPIEVAGESMIIYQGWDYVYEYVDENETIHNRSYDSLCLINSVDSEIEIEEEHPDIEGQAVEAFNRRFAVEKYARGIGLVYREMEVMDRANCPLWFDHPDTLIEKSWCITPWNEAVDAGFIIRQWLVE